MCSSNWYGFVKVRLHTSHARIGLAWFLTAFAFWKDGTLKEDEDPDTKDDPDTHIFTQPVLFLVAVWLKGMVVLFLMVMRCKDTAIVIKIRIKQICTVKRVMDTSVA
jgi:hypothetical protein